MTASSLDLPCLQSPNEEDICELSRSVLGELHESLTFRMTSLIYMHKEKDFSVSGRYQQAKLAIRTSEPAPPGKPCSPLRPG